MSNTNLASNVIMIPANPEFAKASAVRRQLRVAAYCRVSTDSEEQLTSYEAQRTYYTDKIMSNPEWTMAGLFADEGITGTSAQKRPEFLRMIRQCRQKKIDLILTKSVSRFARNTLDSIQFTRELLIAGVGVFFQNDNINTFDEDSELRLTIMSGIAQDELRKLSSRVKFGHQQAIKNNVVLGNSRIFGYRKENKRLVIDEDEAQMVRELFILYATDQYSMKQLETLFWEKGYRNHNGKKIAHTTMSGMISNPKYKGYYVGNKVRVVDMFTKKQKFLPPEEWVMFKDESGEIVPAIVSEELWDAANAVLSRRSTDVKQRQNQCRHANLLTGKLFCTHCGAAYYRRDSKDKHGKINSKWVCSGKIKNGADSCPSVALYEDELKPLLFSVFQDTQADAEAMIDRYLAMYRSLKNEESDTAETMHSLQQKIELANKKKNKLLGFNAEGKLSDRDFLSMNAACDQEIQQAERELYELEQQTLGQEEMQAHFRNLRETLQAAARDAKDGIITRDFVQKYIDRIFVTPETDHLSLEVRIFTGESTMRFLQKLEGRRGHIFLTI